MFRDRSPLNRSTTNNPTNSNMTTNSTLSYNDIQIRFNFAKCMVPEYFGGSKELNYFLTNAKEFIDKFTFTDEVLTSYFFRYVISQIKGEARDLITLHNPKSFEEVKTILLNKYKDPRSEENLLTLLTTSFQNHNQNFEEFALEINQKLHKLKENAQIEYSNQIAFLQLKFNDYERQALYAFISGLKEPYCSFVRQQNPINIDACVNICREYDNIQAQINYKNFLRQNMSKKNVFKQPTHFNSQQISTNRNNFKFENSFSRGPINFPPKRTQQTPFSTNVQANQSPRVNVFKPQNNTSHLPKPTPMSINSRNTYHSFNRNTQNNSQNQRYNHFARQIPTHPGIVVEEIHNTETSSREKPHNPENETNSQEESLENFPEITQYQDLT